MHRSPEGRALPRTRRLPTKYMAYLNFVVLGSKLTGRWSLATPGGYLTVREPIPRYRIERPSMNPIPKQLATFFGVLAVLFAGGALAGQLIDPDARGEDEPMAGHGAEHSDAAPEAAATAASMRAREPEVHGLAVADGGLRARGRAARAAPRPRADARVPDRRRRRRGRARLRRHAREAHAPDHRPPRPDRLPAPAPGDGRRRHLEHARHAARRRLVPPVRGLLARRRGDDARLRPARRRRRRPAAAARPRADRRQRRRLRRAARRGRRARRRGVRAALHDHARRPARRRPSPTSAPAATSSRCARATWRSCTCTRRATAGVGFAATFPTAGRYRLFLQFKHEGRVQTVAFTQEVTR